MRSGEKISRKVLSSERRTRVTRDENTRLINERCDRIQSGLETWKTESATEFQQQKERIDLVSEKLSTMAQDVDMDTRDIRELKQTRDTHQIEINSIRTYSI